MLGDIFNSCMVTIDVCLRAVAKWGIGGLLLLLFIQSERVQLGSDIDRTDIVRDKCMKLRNEFQYEVKVVGAIPPLGVCLTSVLVMFQQVQ